MKQFKRFHNIQEENIQDKPVEEIQPQEVIAEEIAVEKEVNEDLPTASDEASIEIPPEAVETEKPTG